MKYLFRNFISTLRHYKSSSLLNIIGMAVAFGAFYIIMTQVSWGLRYNQHIEGADRIYVLSYPSAHEGRKSICYSRPLAEQIISSATGVEAYGTGFFFADVAPEFYYIKEGCNVRKIQTIKQESSQGLLTLFGFEAEQGSLADLTKPRSVAVSSSFAKEHDLHVGDHLSPNPDGETEAGEIVAVWKDKFAKNSSPGSIEMLYDIGDKYIDDGNEWSNIYFVKLNSKDGAEAFEQCANDLIRQMLVDQGGDQTDIEYGMERSKVSLIPFESIYYSNNVDRVNSISRSGDKTTDTSLLVVAVLIIVIALINFVNFFFALVPARIRSVNTYKIFGTSRTALIVNFILESVGMVVLALLLAYFIVLAITETSLIEFLAAPIAPTANIQLLILTIVVALAGAVLSSLYPAFYITSFQPALALKGTFGTSKAGRTLRNVLIGIQFTISIALIICATFVKLQHNYMMKFDMGFDKEQLLSGVIPSDVAWWNSKNSAFEDKLRNNPDIVDLTWANGELINQSRMGWGSEYKGQNINFEVYPVAYNFLDFMGIEMVEGRNFTKVDEQSETGVLIFNEQARDKFDITLDVSTRGHTEKNAEIAGICKNFHFRPVQSGGDPFAFYVFGQDHSWRPEGLTQIYVRMAAGADPGKVIDFIRTTALELTPDIDPDAIVLNLFDDELAYKYKAEDKLSMQVTGFTLVAIILALMGVFGLVFFETQHRMKEIAVRRVFGAEVKDILSMLSIKYAFIVLICFLIAAPPSWLITERYFSSFAYHTEIQLWVFAGALAIVLAVTVILVMLRSLSAATRNPVESIKAE